MRREHHHLLPVSILLLASTGVAAGAFAFAIREPRPAPAPAPTETPVVVEAETPAEEITEAVKGIEETPKPLPVPARGATVPLPAFGDPIANPRARVRKSFGMYITPQTSPIAGDRFTGYHVGTDFEVTAEELGTDVPIFAICDGPLIVKTMARGYGGVAIQRCTVDGAEFQITYGHLRLASITAEVGDRLAKGDRLGVLGADHSEETDGVRKHLHLGVHLGSTTDIRGYVQQEDETNAWANVLQGLTAE